MRHMFYRLDEHHNPIPMDNRDPDIEVMMRDIKARRVGCDEVGDYRVSTVFLALDHNFSDEGPPILFETMIFPKEDFGDLSCERHATWDEAVAGHRRVVAEVKAGRLPEP